jgi:hypothetical protein
LDAQGQGRGIYVDGFISVTIEGLRLTGGDAGDLNGPGGQGAGGAGYIKLCTITLRNNQVWCAIDLHLFCH